ncbi:MAG: deoxyribose-phosphate aldolase [Anaerolineae bacterium]|nr:MAG: deoxyribose-phosphate aldolase [Anaerolineae bacterium]
MKEIIEILQCAQAYLESLPEAPVPPSLADKPDLAQWIDHTLLKPEATAEQIKQLCDQAIEFGFYSVCVNPVFVPLASGLLSGTGVRVCSVVGFPLGASAATIKALEALDCVEKGATEIDMVMNIGALKGQAYGQVFNDIWMVREVTKRQNVVLKVILEMGLLSREEKIIACLLAEAAGADFVKTSTGFGYGGATVEDVDLMYRVVGRTTRVKAAGGIRTYEDAIKMIGAGASRLGTSAGVSILRSRSQSKEE